MAYVITLTGPSQCGKSTIRNFLLEQAGDGFNPVIFKKYTTRSPREFEDDAICIKDMPAKCDLVYEQYGVRYGFQFDKLYDLLEKGKSPIIVLNDVRAVEDVRTALAPQVVSALAQPVSDEEFLAAHAQPRNYAFRTAIGGTTVQAKNTIAACIYGAQTVTDGQAVRLRLLEPIAVADRLVPRNSLLAGVARIQGERLDILIASIEHEGTIMPVKLSVYDTDGQQGIFIPGSMEMNAVKEVAANMGASLGSSINLSTDAGAQLASDLGRGVLQGASQYIARKVRTVKVHLKAGYRVMLCVDKD